MAGFVLEVWRYMTCCLGTTKRDSEELMNFSFTFYLSCFAATEGQLVENPHCISWMLWVLSDFSFVFWLF